MILYVYNLLLNIGIVKWNSFNISFVWSYYSSWMPSAGCAFGWLHDHRSQDSLGCTSWFGNHVTIGGFQLHHRRRPFCLGRHFLDPCNVTRWVTGLVPVKPLCFLVGGFLDSSIPGQYSVSGLPVHIEDRPRFTWLVNDVSGGRVTVTFSHFILVPSMAKVAVPKIWLIRVCSRLVNSHKCVEDIESIPHLHIEWYRYSSTKQLLSHHWKAVFFPSFEAPWASDRFWSTFWTRRPCESLAGFDVLCQVECPSLASDWGTWEDL